MSYIEIPVVLYTMEQVFLAQGLVYVFKWYLRRDKKEADLKSETPEAAGAAEGADAVALEAAEFRRETIATKAVTV